MREVLRLMLAMFLLMIVTRLMTKGPSKTLASKKAYALQGRFNTAYTAVTAVTGPIAEAGNAAALATFAPQPSPTKLTGLSGVAFGAPSSNSNADLFSWALGAEGTFNTLAAYVEGNLPTAVNDIYDGLQAANVFT